MSDSRPGADDSTANVVPDGRPGSYLLRVGGTDQSHVDLFDPMWLEFGYLQRMAEVIDVIAPPGRPIRFVHVGGAAMTLPRYVTATRPTSAQVVFEPAEDVTALVRAEPPLPARSGIKVRPVDGRTGLQSLRDGYADVVVIDAFDGPLVPGELVTTELARTVRRVLTPDGVLLFNLVDLAPFAWARRAIAAVRQSFPALTVSAETSVLKGRRHGNLVVVASSRGLPLEDLRRRVAASPVPYRVLDDAQTASTLGGGAPFTDLDTMPSPPPPDGRGHFG